MIIWGQYGNLSIRTKQCQPKDDKRSHAQNCCCLGCLMTPEKISKFNFFRNPFVAPGLGVGDHWVTKRVLEHPWGPM